MVIDKQPEKTGTSKMTLGTLYELNKNLIEQHEQALSQEKLEERKEVVINFLKNTKNKYYMLLCREQNDFTVFTLNYDNEKHISKTADILIDECLFNRGQIKGIDMTQSNDAIEIWLSINEESFCYYFFPYDTAIINLDEEV